jgi:hypothetical protein
MLKKIWNLKVNNLFIAILIITITCIVTYYNTKDINLKIAYSGYGPQEYVVQKLHPENFKKDFTITTINYDKSLCMQIFPLMTKYFGINPSTTIYPFMFFQTLLFFLSIAFLTQTLFQNRSVTILSVIIISVSNLAGLNLSRFGFGFSSYLTFPLYYVYANAFRIIGLAYFLKNKYIHCAVFLALSMYCHITMGLFALAFISGYLIYRPSTIIKKPFIQALVVFLLLIIPHIIYIISNSNILSGTIPLDQWVKLTRIFCCHWYPITMKLFTKYAHNEFVPIIFSCLLFFTALRYQDIKDEKNIKIISGIAFCFFISLLGIIFSDIYPVPFLIKISLQRATAFITFFAFLYFIYYLYIKIKTGKFWNIFLSVFAILTLLFFRPGIPILALLILLYIDYKDGFIGFYKVSFDKKQKKIIFICLSFIVLLVFIYVINIVLNHNSYYFKEQYSLLWGGANKLSYKLTLFLILSGSIPTVVIFLLHRFTSSPINPVKTSISVCLICSLIVVGILERDKYIKRYKRYNRIGSSYMEVQKWAKENTPIDALFMPEPYHSYGWRDFSQRSSFGNLREWGYCGIAYDSDYSRYNEGIKRIKDFNIDIEKVSYEDIKNSKTFIYGQTLASIIKKNYYEFNSKQLYVLCSKYGIDYFIMRKRYIKEELRKSFKISFENDIYIVFKSGRLKESEPRQLY